MGFIIVVLILFVVIGVIAGGGSVKPRGPRITKYGRFHKW